MHTLVDREAPTRREPPMTCPRRRRMTAAEAAQLAHTTAALSSALRLTQRMAERPLPAHVRAALPDLSAAQRLVDAEAERLAAIAAALES